MLNVSQILLPKGVLPRRLAKISAAFAATLVLSACAELASSLSPRGSESAQPAPETSNQAPVSGNTIGNGPTRIALILPLSSANGAAPAKSMRNAAEMALAEFNSQDVTLMVKDDRGTAEGAQAAAREAVSQGAQAILGPLFAPTVGAVASVARPANRPVIAFSTDVLHLPALIGKIGAVGTSFIVVFILRKGIVFAKERT